MKVLLSWNGGASQQYYTFPDELVAQVYASANANGVCSQVFRLTVTGIAGITDMTVCALVESGTGGESTNAPKAEELLPLYTGCYQGQEAKLIIEDRQAYLAMEQYMTMDEQDLEEAGLTGTVQASIVNKQKFGKVTVKDGRITLTEAEAGYYTAYNFAGTAAEGYIAYLRELYAALLAAGNMSQESYAMMLELLDGKDVFFPSDYDADLEVEAVVTADGLIQELVFIYPEYTVTTVCQYDNGVVTKEIGTTIYHDEYGYSDNTYYEIVYYPDGKTVKVTEVYYMEQNADGQWEKSELCGRVEYREDGSTAVRTECWDGNRTVTEFDENNIRIRSTTYNAAGEIVEAEECYDNGTTKKHTNYYADGSREVEEYNEKGGMVRYAYYEADGTLGKEKTYTYEYYADGLLKSCVGKDMDGNIVESQAYTYYEDGQKKTEITVDEEGGRYEAERYEDGSYKSEAYYYPDDSGSKTEYYENGRQKLQAWFYSDGTKDVWEYDAKGNQTRYAYYDENGEMVTETTYVYEYYPDGSIKSYVGKNLAGQVTESGAYTYYADGTIKTQIIVNAEGRFETEYFENGDNKYESGQYADGSSFEAEYNEQGDTVKQSYRNADGSGYEEAYNENGDLIQSVSYGSGGVVESELTYQYEYDDNGNVVKYTCYNADGVLYEIEEYTYYENGTRKTEKGSNIDGSRWEYGFDEDGCKITVLDYFSDGSGYQCEYYLHSEAIKFEAHLDADGTKEAWTYDEQGNATKCAYYDADGVLTQEYTYAYEYYPNGSEKSHTVTDINGNTVEQYTYYENGNTATWFSIDEDGTRWEKAYYADGKTKLDETCYPDGSGSRAEYYENGKQKLRIWLYSSGTREEEEFDEQGNQTRYAYYDENGEALEEKYYTYEYNPDGSIASYIAKNEKGQVVESNSYTYYSSGTMKTYTGTDAEGRTWEYAYYENGMTQREFRSWSDGSWWEYGYDENNTLRTYRERYTNGNGYDEEYDEAGRIIKAVFYGEGGVFGSQETYRYELYEDGSVKTKWCYGTEGELDRKLEFTYHPNGMIKDETVTYADGSRMEEAFYETGILKSYCTYDEYGDLLIEQKFDENGNLITA